jgi:hypothetical protein
MPFNYLRNAIFAFALSLLVTSAFAKPYDSEANREAIVSQRNKRFFKASSSKEYFSIGGIYSSDYNSKKYSLNSRYLYQSFAAIHELNFEHETNYADKGSGANKEFYVKDSELYDLTLASKLRIADSRNYGVFFHRSIYDQYSDYYYDNRTALGVGRMFFNEKIELDFSLGYQDIKNYGYKVDFISSIRSNIKITKNITLTQRGYIFLDHETMDNGLKTSLVYRLDDKMSFEIRNNFEQRRYEDNQNHTVVNRANRSITIGLIFDLN